MLLLYIYNFVEYFYTFMKKKFINCLHYSLMKLSKVIIKVKDLNEFLNDELNLNILLNICSGKAVNVNISELSRSLKKHRNTIRNRLINLFENKIIDKPIYPFYWLYYEYPLMVIERADFPRDKLTNNFIEVDPHIFAAFFKKDEEYNTLLIEYFRDIEHHQNWRDTIIKEGKLPPKKDRYPSDIMYFSNKSYVKYNPAQMALLLEQDVDKHKGLINDYQLDELSIQILKKLAFGEGIQTNEHYLAEQLGVHRKTIEKRINIFLSENIVLPPVCRFPRFLVPPDYILVLSLKEIKKNANSVLRAWNNDHHVPLILRASVGRYTHLIFSCFYRIRDHLNWEEEYDQRFPDCIGAVNNKYLSPSMMFSIAQQFVSLELIKHKLNLIHGKKIVEMMTLRTRIGG